MATEPHNIELIDLRKLTVQQQNAIDILITGSYDMEAAEAVVLRALGSYRITLCIDERSDTAEVLPLILTIFKLSFDGQNVARCDLNDQRRIITYP